MKLSRQQAWQKLNSLIDNPNLIKHCLAVEAAMGYYADYFNMPPAEKEKWQITGLLHDADWEKYPDKHPQVIVQWLKDQGEDEDVINAIAAHGFEFGVEPKTLMARVLRAVDELTGLIVAVALVKGHKLANVQVKSVLKKMKDKSFARGVNREDIKRGAEEIELPLEEHIAHTLSALQNIADDLGL